MSDRLLIYATAFVRATATGFVGVALGLYLARIGQSAATTGAVVSAGLAGAALAATLATLFADRIGRRRFLALTALVGAVGTGVFVLVVEPWALALASFAAMLNGMGRDRGAAVILKQAALPATTDDAGRTRVFAWYTMLQDIGHGLGALLAGLPTVFVAAGPSAGAIEHRIAFLVCAGIALATAPAYLRMGAAVEETSDSTHRLRPTEKRSPRP